jgi:hypothetical protein
MLTKVEVIGASAGMLTLLLGGPNQSPIQIRDISGLEPVKAEITTVPSNKDGDLFQNARLGKRNIVFKLGLDPNWVNQTMSTLRHMLYTHFPPKTWRTLKFYSDDMPTVEVGGYIESNEPNMFSQDPEIQISIICPKPKFVGLNGITEYAGL